MLVLFETPAGYALFKVSKEVASASAQDVWKHFTSPEKAAEGIKLKAFSKFEDTTAALSAATAICDGKLDKGLKKFLSSSLKKGEQVQLGVPDSKLGGLIKEKLDVQCVYDSTVLELIRGIRQHSEALISGLSAHDSQAFKLGLSHSLCRYKLKFSPDKVDTMIVQAIGLLDELDKELNTYAMRAREWYGWHFPEMSKIVQENLQFAKCVKLMQVRTRASSTDFSSILSEEVEQALKDAAEVSMGTEIAEEDVANITQLCDQVISITEYRSSLYEYLRHRMNAIAPNLTVMVGELVGARLIAHAGSLMSLAKHPASTVQILGAEKALFRALKTKHDTPKYGLIYHASLVGQAAPKMKGKISRMLAAKTALSVRMDALGELADGDSAVGIAGREKVEMRLRQLEGSKIDSLSSAGKKRPDQEKYVKPATAPKSYNADADMIMSTPSSSASSSTSSSSSPSSEKDKKDKKKDKKEKKEKKAEKESNGTGNDEEEESSKKKDKKRKAEEAAEEEPEKKKKKKDKKD